MSIRLIAAMAAVGLGACTGPPAPAPPPSSPPRAPSPATRAAPTSATPTTAIAASPSAPPPPATVEPAEELRRALKPRAANSLLLLGFHTEILGGYTPMFTAEGKPRTDPAAGYRTLLIRTGGGSARAVGELPFLAVPQPTGFLFVGEESVTVSLPDDPRLTMADGNRRPRNYDATELWKTSDAKQIDSVSRKLRAELKRKQQWGVEETTQLVYVTRTALCTTHTSSEVTGGALWFTASTTMSLSAIAGGHVDGKLAAHVDAPTFRRFTAKLVGVNENKIELDRPFLDSFALYVWQDDVTACLDRDAGALSLVGSIMVAGNSARSFARTAPVMPASAALAPAHEAVDIDMVKRAIPGALDAFVSPAHDVVLAARKLNQNKPIELVVWDVAGGREAGTLWLPGRPVMDEWASDTSADAWQTTLAPHLRH